MSEADIGIAMGAGGYEVAIEAAGITLTDSDSGKMTRLIIAGCSTDNLSPCRRSVSIWMLTVI